MKISKKLLALLLVLMMVTALFGGVSAYADSEQVELAAELSGDTVSVKLVAREDMSFGGLTFAYSYDSDAFSYESVSSVISGVTENADEKLVVLYGTADVDVGIGAEILTLSFQKTDGYVRGEAYTFSLSFSEAYDPELEDYDFAETTLSVTVQEQLADPSAAEVALTVTQTTTLEDGASKNDGVVKYTLTTSDSSAPMPGGTQDGAYSVKLKGSGTYTLPVLRFSEEGVWEYTLTAESEKASVSPEKIRITITVRAEGDTLVPVVTAELPNGESCELDFTVVVPGTETPQETEKPSPGKDPKTGDEAPVLLYTGATLLTGFALILLICVIRKKEQSV